MNQRTKRVILISLGCLAAIGLIYLLYLDFKPDFNQFFNHPSDERHLLIESIRSHGLKDAYLLILLIILLSAIPGLPVSVICIPVGICYGPYLGTLINLIGIIGGNLLVIGLFKQTKLTQRKRPNRVLTDIQHMRHPYYGLTLGYMIPVVPAFLVNLTVIKLKVPFNTLISIVSIGSLPTAILYSLGGDALFKGDYVRIIPIILLIFGLFLLIKQIKKERHILDYIQDK